MTSQGNSGGNDAPQQSATVLSFEGSPFRLHQPFPPAGDQPEAIRLLCEGVEDGLMY